MREMSGEEREELRRKRTESRTGTTYKAFLRELSAAGGLDEQQAERAATSVLCALEMRLIRGEADDLEAQLPRRLQDLLHRCERHEGLPPDKFGARELVDLVSADLDVGGHEAERAIRAVLDTVGRHVSPGEVAEVFLQLPPDLRSFWTLDGDAAAAVEDKRARRDAGNARQAARAAPRPGSSGPSHAP
jgi:uncharacterized protein (DUF2267 family)